jgi:hypothetical protein
MKHLKILWLAAASGAALMALTGTAAATTFTSPENTTYTGTILAEGTATAHGVSTTTCEESKFEITIEQHGEAVTGLGMENKSEAKCNNHTTILKQGTSVIHAGEGGDAVLTSDGGESKVEITSLGLTCIYSTEETELGLIEGSNEKNATISINSVSIPRTGGSVFCGSTSELTGSYTVTSPKTLYVE